MAKDVITRFKLETTQYDSKIRDASKELSNFSKTATQAKEGFNQFTKANVDAARALGTMATSSTNAKQKTIELVGAFNEAAKAYNQLTEEQKRSDWAKALSGSLTQLQQRIKDAKQEMQGLGNEMKSSGLFGGGKLDGMLQVFGGNLMTKGAGMLAGLASEMGDMILQGIELAKQGEGIRIAFERLGRGDILDGLREATHGTVTDLELMKAAVKFNDFKLPVEELGTMLAFAQQKAKDTGQSIDYMVDSIVTGLGRKSLMILDNLGLSAAEIKSKMAETGDMTKAVGEIIREQMESAGEYVETAADRAAQANVSLQNQMEELGRKFAPLQEASNTFWTSVKTSILDIVGGPMADFLNNLTEAGRRMSMLNNMKGGGEGGTPSKIERQLSALRGSNYKEQKYQSQVNQYDHDIKVAEYYKQKYQNAGWAGGSVLSDVTRRFGVNAVSGEDIDNIINSLRTMRSEYIKSAKEIMQPVKTNVDIKGAEQNISKLKNKLKELEDERKKAVKAGDNDMVDMLTKQINTTKQNITYLDPNAFKTTQKKDLDELQKIQKKIADLTKEAYTADGERLNTIRKEIEGLQEQESKLLKIKDLVTGKGPDLDKLFPDMSASNYNTGYANSQQAKIDSARQDFAMSPLSMESINAYLGKIKSALQDADLGSDLYNSLTEKLKDATTMSTLLQELMKRGLEGAKLEEVAKSLQEKLLSEGIDQEAIKKWLDRLNQQLKKEGLSEIGIDDKTGKAATKTKQKDPTVQALEKFNGDFSQITGGIGSIASGIQQLGIELPQGIQDALGVLTGISSIITGITSILSLILIAEQSTAAASWTDAIIPFANGGIVPKFANGGLIGKAAGGMLIPGTSYSGDKLRMPVDGGRGFIGVNSGELILNASSQRNIADDLLSAQALVQSIGEQRNMMSRAQQGGTVSQLAGTSMQNIQLEAIVTAEQLKLVQNNRGKRTGRGEVVYSKRAR